MLYYYYYYCHHLLFVVYTLYISVYFYQYAFFMPSLSVSNETLTAIDVVLVTHFYSYCCMFFLFFCFIQLGISLFCLVCQRQGEWDISCAYWPFHSRSFLSPT